MTNETRTGFGAGGIFLAFLGGALAASAAVLLLAPRSGAETRARIGEAVGRTEEQVRRARLAAREAASAARVAFTEAMRDDH
jgi:gas vesicle protein